MSAVAELFAVIGAFVAGAFWWSLWEYGLHRFAFHVPRGKWFGSKEHLNHHVHAGWNMDPLMLLIWLGVALSGLGWGVLVSNVAGSGAVGIAFGSGWALAYYFYEWQHRSAHVHPPRNRWQRWLRLHHFHHHFGHPMANQGVSMPVWDVVFRTLEIPGQVKVPRRLAMPWLVDDDGEVRVEYAADYVLIGHAGTRPRAAVDSDDKVRAYANLAPTADAVT